MNVAACPICGHVAHVPRAAWPSGASTPKEGDVSGFHGRYYPGYLAVRRKDKRLEAEVRNAPTPPERRRKARRNRARRGRA